MMRRSTIAWLVFTALLGCGPALGNCDKPEGTFKLYRGSLLPGERIHVATFDAPHGGAYNGENCLTAKKLFESQPGVIVRYWCEPASAQLKR
jgi:hypothetical protein